MKKKKQPFYFNYHEFYIHNKKFLFNIVFKNKTIIVNESNKETKVIKTATYYNYNQFIAFVKRRKIEENILKINWFYDLFKDDFDDIIL